MDITVLLNATDDAEEDWEFETSDSAGEGAREAAYVDEGDVSDNEALAELKPAVRRTGNADVDNNGSGNRTETNPVARYVDVFPALRTAVFRTLERDDVAIKRKDGSVLWVAMWGHLTKTYPAPNQRRLLVCDNLYTRHNLTKTLTTFTDGEMKMLGTIRIVLQGKWMAERLEAAKERMDNAERGASELHAALDVPSDWEKLQGKHKRAQKKLPTHLQTPYIPPASIASNAGYIVFRDTKTVIVYSNDLAGTPSQHCGQVHWKRKASTKAVATMAPADRGDGKRLTGAVHDGCSQNRSALSKSDGTFRTHSTSVTPHLSDPVLAIQDGRPPLPRTGPVTEPPRTDLLRHPGRTPSWGERNINQVWRSKRDTLNDTIQARPDNAQLKTKTRVGITPHKTASAPITPHKPQGRDAPITAPDQGQDMRTDGSRTRPSQPKPTTKAAAKRKSKKKKKKLRAPESADEKLPMMGGKNAGRQYTAEELDYALCKTQLARMLERDPNLSFLRPKLISELTGPIHVPDWESIADVRMALFRILREAGFVMGAFEMEKMYDWELASWKDSIRAVTVPLTGLVGMVKYEAQPPQDDRKAVQPPPLASPYPSSARSDSSIESPKRMPMSGRLPRIMQLTAAPERTETPPPEDNAIPKALEDAIIRLMQPTTMRTTNVSARPGPTPTVRTTPPATTLREPADVAMASVSSQSTPRSKRQTRNQDEAPDDLFDLETGTPGTAAAVSTATAGTGLPRVRLSAFSELKKFHGRDASEEKARAWFNRAKSASRHGGMTGEEVCALFGDLMAGPARQWYLQLSKNVRRSWTDLTEQFRIQYCGKGVSMVSRYFHASKHPDETPLEYLYRLNVAAMRAKIPYADGTAEDRREHVELFINTLGSQEQELASRLTLMEVLNASVLEKKLRARRRGLVHQKKTLFGSSKFRQKAPASPAPHPRAVHAIHATTDGYDSGRESCDSEDLLYDQDRDVDDRAKMFVTGQTPPGEPARREAGSDDAGRDRSRYRHCGSRRHHYAPQKWIKQAKIHGKLNNRRGVLLLDTGAEVSILDTTFAREIGCLIDTDVTQNCVGIRDETYYTVGRTRVKITLAGNLVRVRRKSYLRVTNIEERRVTLDAHTPVGWWTPAESIPRAFGFVQLGSRQNQEWQNLAYSATCDADDVWVAEAPSAPMVARPAATPVIGIVAATQNARSKDQFPDGESAANASHDPEPETETQDDEVEDAVLVHEGSDLCVEELDAEMAILPDLLLTAEVKVEDVKVGQLTGVEPEVAAREGDRLRQIIWKRRKWFIGKGNALPPAGVGVICDIDVGDAKSVAQRVRKIPPQFKEKVADVTKGILSTGMIQPSTSPWASPIVVIVKKNGVDIRLCIDYRLVNDLTRLMVYPMPLVNDLLEDLDKYLWYYSLDMASGFWVVPMTDRARLISAFITPLGLFEWLRMPFGLCNAPQIYPRLLDNALYGFLRPSPENAARDVFEGGEPERPGTHSVLGRCSICNTLYALTESDFGEYETTPGVREQEKWGHALRAFEMLKSKLATTPMLNHFDAEREPVVIVYANDWAFADVLAQVHEDVCMPVKSTSRTLKPNELNYNIVEKEILALLRALNECFTMPAGRAVRVLTRHTTLAWLFRSKGLQGRLSQWAAVLSPWRLELCRSVKGEEEILWTLVASISPRKFVDAALEEVSPRKRPPRTAVIPVASVAPGEELQVMSFDGSAKVKREGGAFSAAVWKLPGWEVARATFGYATDLTVNEAEYRGLLLGCSLLQELEVSRQIICGDSNLVIRQMREEMDSKSPGLKLLKQHARNVLKNVARREPFHVRRDWNACADMLAGQALQSQARLDVIGPEEIQSLKTLNRLGEVIRPRTGRPETSDPERPMTPSADAERTTAIMLPVATRAASAQAAAPRSRTPGALQERAVQRLRLDRIRTAQDEELWIANLKRYLRGELGSLSKSKAKDCCKIAPQYEEGESRLLYRTRGDESAEDRDSILKSVVPETLQDDFLHHYHASLEVGHQGIGRTYQRVRRLFHWPGILKSVQRCVGECADCETGKGRPKIRGESPGNIIATYPFQVIAMNHIASLPVSCKGNTELLVWVNLFTGFVIAKANASRSAQTVAVAYEEALFRRFGVRRGHKSSSASQGIYSCCFAPYTIRNDREPGFMADFFKAFNKLMGQRQRATLVYRPQANGAAERMVQTVTRAVKMYIADVDQRDWYDYAERLTFALNTAHDRTRDETPFYLVHGWDARFTLEATLSIGNTSHRDADARRWRMRIQRHYKLARAQVLELVQEAVAERARRHNEGASQHSIETGSRVWLYLDRVKPGYARKLAHMWHGPFRVAERVNTFAVRLETAGTPYQLFTVVHISKLKPVREFPTRPETRLTVPADGRFDFDEELLPEDSWNAQNVEDDGFEVEKILDVREGRATRYGRTRREFEVKWKGYPDSTWVEEADLNCGGLILSGAVKVEGKVVDSRRVEPSSREVAGTRKIDEWEVGRTGWVAEDGTTGDRPIKKSGKKRGREQKTNGECGDDILARTQATICKSSDLNLWDELPSEPGQQVGRVVVRHRADAARNGLCPVETKPRLTGVQSLQRRL
ncbi:unnamed protein product [Phytophthora fragariaefolia]|uniref:RNA-directed DNA polymerase n=1 Tax=Phytophthora fragariaefolia TaxID=1490495 RepID=A0A9W6UEP4_9STRA|nr:unnamed protein product [Phytophthora fragariaefolia]